MKQLKIKTDPNCVNLIIDGKYLAYRTKYSRSTSELSYRGEKTGIYYGFLNSLRMLGNKFFPTNTIIMWDSDSSQAIRRRQFAGYKNRNDYDKKTPEEKEELRIFAENVKTLEDICEKIGFASHILQGYEADDLIALWVNRFSNMRNVIVTRDEDMYQCLSKDAVIYNPDEKIIKDANWLKRKYDITPDQWYLVKAIGGCKSDTVPGVPGIGEVKAVQYIKGNASAKMQEKINAHETDIELYKKLVTLPHADLNNYVIKFKQTKLDLDYFFELCQAMGFRQFMEQAIDFQTAFS